MGSGYTAGPGQIVPRGYSTGPGQKDPRLFSRTQLNSYKALTGNLTGPKCFYAEVFTDFLFVFLYFIMCIVFKIHPFFFRFVLNSFLKIW